MNFIEGISNLLRRGVKATPIQPPSPAYSYRIYWTKRALDWTVQERRLIKAAASEVIGSEEFRANPYRRIYTLKPVDGLKHSGESVLALHDVLEGLNLFDRQEGTSDEPDRGP